MMCMWHNNYRIVGNFGEVFNLVIILANFEENRQHLNNVFLWRNDYVCTCACEREQCEFSKISQPWCNRIIKFCQESMLLLKFFQVKHPTLPSSSICASNTTLDLTRLHFWQLLASSANGVAGQPADPCITSLVYCVMRLRSQFVKSPNLKFANIFKGVIRQI